ncbi:unnamed protein product [Soboliphyme baturini]|uniref:Neur_chan_LBD domain-containing protein n=1 Tax=Soboliphyme baturini TaxID=241478 RepID=A0A183IZ89_9BILA|nr:unnamed protein product [Soboliphyme baturini]
MLRQTWHDERLNYEKLSENMNIHVPILLDGFDDAEIRPWLPDIYFANQATSGRYSYDKDYSLIQLFPDGTIKTSSSHGVAFLLVIISFLSFCLPEYLTGGKLAVAFACLITYVLTMQNYWSKSGKVVNYSYMEIWTGVHLLFLFLNVIVLLIFAWRMSHVLYQNQGYMFLESKLPYIDAASDELEKDDSKDSSALHEFTRRQWRSTGKKQSIFLNDRIRRMGVVLEIILPIFYVIFLMTFWSVTY